MRTLTFVLLGVALTAGTASGQAIRFAAPHELSTGAYPTAVQTGDFNGDGHRDLAVANQHSDSVTILLGSGYGHLQRIVNCKVGRFPVRLGVADFDGDGRDDVVVAAAAAATISILLTGTDGTCRPPVDLPTAAYPFAIAVADYDGDGHSDVAVLVRYSDAVWLFRGTGDGSFAAPTGFATGIFPFDLVAGDFDRNGTADLVASSVGGEALALLAGGGDGTFTRTDLPALYATLDLAAADLNGDGSQDLLVTDYQRRPIDGVTTRLRLGNGDGTFTEAGGFSNSRLPATGDFNGDGRLDVVLADEDAAEVGVWLGNGDGTFGAPLVTVTGGVARDIAVDDFNEDGRLDFVAAHEGNNVSVRLGKGDGTFLREPRTPILQVLDEIPMAHGTVAADFNGDGYDDLAVAGAYKDTVLFLMNDGRGTLSGPAVYEAGHHVLSLGGGDFNGDGHQDVAVPLSGDPGIVRMLLGNGDGTFADGPESALSESPLIAAVADMNEDLRLDLVVMELSSTRQEILVFLGDGDGAFNEAGRVPDFIGGPQGVAVGDLNGDGRMDLAVTALAPDGITVALGNGDGTFGSTWTLVPDDYPFGIAAGFLDGDTHLDLVVAQRQDDAIGILIGNGDGTFQPPVAYYAGGLRGERLRLGDFNGDDRLDVVVLNTRSNCVSALAGDGSGHLAPPAVSAGTGEIDVYNSYVGTLVVGRFNGDDRPDVAAVGDMGVSMLFNVTQPAPAPQRRLESGWPRPARSGAGWPSSGTSR